MKKFYFTFASGHLHPANYQVIFAKSEDEACLKMHELYGNRWALCYSSEQWLLSKAEGFFRRLTPLENVYAFAS